MKFTFFGILIIFLTLLMGCSTTPEREVTKQMPNFMSSSQIDNQFKVMKQSGQKDEPIVLSVDDYSRFEQLIPLEKFFSNIPDNDFERKIKLNDNNNRLKNEGVDFRIRDSPVRSQWNGTCTANALVAVWENLNNKTNSNNIILSARHLWAEQGEAYSCDISIKTMSDSRICDNKYWLQTSKKAMPGGHCNKNKHAKILEYEYLGNDVDSVIDSLDKGFPVYLAMSTPYEMVQCKKIISPYSPKTNGGHALAIVGYVIVPEMKGEGYFIIKNSWGSDCGDNGYQYLPFYQCENGDGYCIFWEVSKIESKKNKYVKKKICYPKKFLWWKWKKCYWKLVES